MRYNLPITAEGVETDKQALFLTLAGCEKLQGWHYGRAETQTAITAMLAKPELIELGPPRSVSRASFSLTAFFTFATHSR